MKIKLSHKERNLIQEIIRRVQCFHDGRLNDKLLLLAYQSELKELIAHGIVELSGDYMPRCLTWSHLTERGIKILKQLRRKKLFSKRFDYSGNSCGFIPNSVTIHE